jgi:formylglycine-generating enzyme required for sulfatase activity
MIVLAGPVEFPMGAPLTEPRRNPEEKLHRQRIGQSYAIASTSVTVEQFQRFLAANEKEKNNFVDSRWLEKVAPDPDCPIVFLNWFLAAQYCNWLSQEEGLPKAQWCYEPNPDGEYTQGMRPALQWWKRTGYRLPTEAEWEYACRAGSVTARCYGETDELLDYYACHQANAQDRTWPGGRLKPNDWGLFDVHGNVWNWCQNKYELYEREKEGKAIEDNTDANIARKDTRRVLRGASYFNPALFVRAAFRGTMLGADRAGYVGLRVVRTFR